VPRLSRRVPAIPSGDLASMRRPWVITTIVRLALLALMIALLAGAFVAARGLEPREAAFLPEGTTGIIVLDVSQSVTDPVYRRIARTLERIASSRQSVALVAFSDLPYELLPPGSPAKELRPIIRFFEPRPGYDEQRTGLAYPHNPWNEVFSGGTQISSGLVLAEELIEREQIANPSILLISDLDTAPSDETTLTSTLARFETTGVNLRIVPLFANDADLAYFERLVGKDAMVSPARLDAEIAREAESSLVGAARAARRVACLRAHCERVVVPPRGAAERSGRVRRRLVALSLAILCGVGSLVGMLTALDVLRWRDAVKQDDVRFRTAPAAPDLWQPDARVPGDPAAHLLAVSDDMRYREVMRAFYFARLRQPPIGDPAIEAARGEAIIRLSNHARVERDDIRRAEVFNMLGAIALAVLTRERQTDARVTSLEEAIAHFREAVRLDRSNEDAKFNLENALRLLRDEERSFQSPGGRRPRDVATSAGLRAPGSGY
jgi:VWA domain-containing protein